MPDPKESITLTYYDQNRADFVTTEVRQAFDFFRVQMRREIRQEVRAAISGHERAYHKGPPSRALRPDDV